MDPRFTYVQHLHDLAVGQERIAPMGGRYRIVAIERSGYCVCQHHKKTKRIWCDLLSAWRHGGDTNT